MDSRTHSRTILTSAYSRRYVQANMLYTLEGLETQENLDTLNISGNRLQKLENLAGCANLHTLLCSSNELETVEDILHLTECTQLSTLDLQDNKLADPEARHCRVTPAAELDWSESWAIVGQLVSDQMKPDPVAKLQVLNILKQLPDLRCLYLKGNPVVSNIRHYRKVIIASIPTLTYLDDRPIFDTERRCAEAW